MPGIILSPEDRAVLQGQESFIPLGIRHSFVLSLTLNLMGVSQLTLGKKGQEVNLFLALKQPLTHLGTYQETIKHPFPCQHISEGKKKKSPCAVYPYQLYPVTQEVWDMDLARPEVQFP